MVHVDQTGRDPIQKFTSSTKIKNKQQLLIKPCCEYDLSLVYLDSDLCHKCDQIMRSKGLRYTEVGLRRTFLVKTRHAKTKLANAIVQNNVMEYRNFALYTSQRVFTISWILSISKDDGKTNMQFGKLNFMYFLLLKILNVEKREHFAYSCINTDHCCIWQVSSLKSTSNGAYPVVVETKEKRIRMKSHFPHNVASKSGKVSSGLCWLGLGLGLGLATPYLRPKIASSSSSSSSSGGGGSNGPSRSFTLFQHVTIQ
ncbi:hypothetical protein WN51_04399 [Melipona quadrifasciata]|uniref:Uncharacterized protein n=1 Tax=Melipona quadrifasciata TaxID=166423 RepID=A0A0M8ZUB0_9HYME|nr:hypothetical protein WN51_04399 [Melipona quadrifasciata]